MVGAIMIRLRLLSIEAFERIQRIHSEPEYHFSRILTGNAHLLDILANPLVGRNG